HTDYTVSTNAPAPSSSTVLYFNCSNTSSDGFWKGKNLTKNTGEQDELYVAVARGREYSDEIYNGEYWVKLEKGNKATDWTPAPEDVEAEISSLSAELSVQAGEIEAKADSSTVNALGTRVSTAETKIS